MRKYTEELLEPIVRSSKSYAEVLRKLGLKQTGGSQSNIIRNVKIFNISTAHFLGQGHQKGKPHVTRKSANEVLVLRNELSHPEQSFRLRRALLESGRKEICECGQKPFWKGKSLRLQIDHINGKRYDNREKNLRFLCPNCHSQTDNWGSKNIKRL